MTKLEELMQKLCPDGVEYKTIGDLCNISRGRVMSKDYIKENVGQYPVYSSQTENNGQFGSISTFDFDGEYLTWTTDGANAGSVFYRNEKFSITNVCGLLKVKKSSVNTRFLYFSLSVEAKKHVNSGMGNPKLMSNVMAKIKIPVPPLSVQEEIVHILDVYTELTAKLTEQLNAELTSRKKQYEYYKEDLLCNPQGAVKQTTKDITTKRFWLMPATPHYVSMGVPYITSKNVRNGKIDFSDVKYISQQDYEEISKNRAVKEGDLLITMIGTIGETAFVHEYTEFYGQNIYLIRFDESKCLRKYFYYYFSMETVRNAIVSKKNASSQGYIKAGDIDNLSIPIPPLAEQQRIVSILDRFDILCNDLTSGLPAEIEARQKQYEYYRDKLLTFKQLDA